MIKILLHYKANINAKDKKNRTVLYSACYRNKLKIINYLLKKNASLNICDRYGQSPIYTACKFGYED